MATFEFEGMGGIDAEVTSFETLVVETGGGAIPPREPQTVLHLNKTWQIEVNWDVIGANANMVWNAGQGCFIISAYLESIGLATEYDLGSVRIPMAGTTAYSAVLSILAGTVAEVGPYKLVVTLTADNGTLATPGVPFAAAGYMEGPILQFFQEM